MDTFASRLQYARGLRQLSQAALARKCNLSQSAIASYESGARRDTSKILVLADALGVNALWLSTGRGPMFPATGALALQENTWPFASISPQQFWSLTASDREMAEHLLATFVEGRLKAHTS